MSSLLIASLASGLMLFGTALGVYLNRRLPNEHLSEATKDIVKLATGIIATIAGLVLSLLISTAKSSYDSVDADVKAAATDFVMLDRTLAQLGPQAVDIRRLLRQTLESATKIDHRMLLTLDGDPKDALGRTVHLHETLEKQIRLLEVKNPGDGELRERALSLTHDLSKARWMLQLEESDSLPPAFLAIVMLWLAIIFTGFGLFTPPNPTAIGALVVGAVSISAALFLINELNTPFYGFVRISGAPLVKTMQIIGPLP